MLRAEYLLAYVAAGLKTIIYTLAVGKAKDSDSGTYQCFACGRNALELAQMSVAPGPARDNGIALSAGHMMLRSLLRPQKSLLNASIKVSGCCISR